MWGWILVPKISRHNLAVSLCLSLNLSRHWTAPFWRTHLGRRTPGASRLIQDRESKEGSKREKMMAHVAILVIAILMRRTGDVVRQEHLRPGDHVFVHRLYGAYSHHGIYVGGGCVIHFTRTGVDKTSLDSFQQEGEELRLYAYGQPQLWYWLSRWGTCSTLLKTKSPQDVVNKAQQLLEHDNFGEYDLFHNNCEHFATFCRTGLRASAQTYLVSACEQKIKEIEGWAMKIVLMKWATKFQIIPKIDGRRACGTFRGNDTSLSFQIF